MFILLQKPSRYFAVLVVPYLILLASNESHLHSRLRDIEYRDGSLSVPIRHNNSTLAITLATHTKERIQTRENASSNRFLAKVLNNSLVDDGGRCGYSQPHCDRKKALASYRSYKFRKAYTESVLLKSQLPCSCLSAMQSLTMCCQKAVIVVHKMGITAIQDLTRDYFKSQLHESIATPEIMHDHTSGRLFEREFFNPFISDYRHVVVTRDWYDSMISGYLYHKAGKECWLDWYGRPGHEGWLLNNSDEDWELRLLHHNTGVFSRHPWRPGNGRDLCTYLVEESEEEGLRVYATWSMVTYMQPLLKFRRRRLQSEMTTAGRTIFVCYEQLVDPKTFSFTVFEMFKWLHPRLMPLYNASKMNATYQGGHASDQDPTLRIRLRKILSSLDTAFFDGAIRKGSAVFGCGTNSNADPV